MRYSQAEIVTHLAKALVLPLITFRVVLSSWAQLFDGRLAFNLGLNLTRVSLSCVQKHFLGQFSLLFLELPIINLLTKRIKTEMLFKLTKLNLNLALTLVYLNPALNNAALFCCCSCLFLLSFLAVLHLVLRVLKLACATIVACLSRISWFIANLSRSIISI